MKVVDLTHLRQQRQAIQQGYQDVANELVENCTSLGRDLAEVAYRAAAAHLTNDPEFGRAVLLFWRRRGLRVMRASWRLRTAFSNRLFELTEHLPTPMDRRITPGAGGGG